MASQCPIHGMENVRLNRSPYDSMIVSSKNGKAPERQGMRHARHRPLQQLALPDHLDGLRRHVPAGMLAHGLDPLRGRLPAERQPLQPPQPAPGDRECDHSQDQADGHPQDHANLLNIRSSSVAVQPRHNMITSTQTLPRPEPAPAPTQAEPYSFIANSLSYLNPFSRTGPVSLAIPHRAPPAKPIRPTSAFTVAPAPFSTPELPASPAFPRRSPPAA